MATYSRSTSTIQSSQAQPQVASQDLGSFVVKTLENIVNENKDEEDKYEKNDDYLKDIQETITKGIDDSQMVKGKNGPVTGKKDPLSGSGLSSLLVNRNRQDSSATAKLLQKQTDDNKKRNAGLMSLLSNQNRDKVIERTREKEKNTEIKKLSKKVHKLPGPTEIGKVMLSSFTVAGITAGFKKLGTMALGLGALVAVGSQLVVLAKAAIYKLKAAWPVEKAKIGAKLKSWFTTLPDQIMIGLKKIGAKVLPYLDVLPDKISNVFAQLFDKFHIGEHGLTKEEQKEYDKLLKDMNDMRAKADKKFDAKMENVRTSGNAINTYANEFGMNADFNFDYVNATDEEYNKYRKKLLSQAKVKTLESGGLRDFEGELEGMFSKLEKNRTQAKEAIAKLDTGKYQEMQTRLFELQEKSKSPYDKEARKAEEDQKFREAQAKWETKLDTTQDQINLKNKQAQSYHDTLVQAVEDSSKPGGTAYTAYQQNLFGKDIVQEAQAHLEDQGYTLKTAEATKEEKWLQNEFQAWKDAWKDFGKNLSQNIGVQVVQRDRPRNSAINSQSNR